MHTHHRWIDMMRVLATCMVLMLHLCIRPLEQYGNIDAFNWYLAVTIRNITTISVPLFFMISGYLYLNKPELHIKPYLKKRLIYIVIPFFVWSYIWLSAHHFMSSSVPDISSVFLPLKQPTMYHLWFMYPLIALYLAVPLLHAMCRNMSLELKRYALILWLAFSGILGYGIYFQLFSFGFQPHMLTALVGYFISGYLIISFRLPVYCVMITILAILIIMICGTVFMTDSLHPIFVAFYELPIFHVMLLSLCVFWLCYHYRDTLPHISWMQQASSYCYFVYFIHPLFIVVVNKYVFTLDNLLPLYYFPVSTIIVISTSFATAAIAHKIGLKKILG